MNDAVVLSDLHLGSDNCQAEAIASLLDEIRTGELPAKRILLNGDVFDSIDFRRLKKFHWKVLSLLRKLSDTIEILWVNGNHDGPSEMISHLLGVEVRDEAVIESGSRKILFLHGHRFDDFIEAYPNATWIADRVYRLLQRIDRSHTFAKFAKRNSKTFLRCAEQIERESVAYARTRGCQVVCCGHTHLATATRHDGIEYFNSGCWTEKPCHYLTLRNGIVRLHEYRPAEVEAVHARLEPVLAMS